MNKTKIFFQNKNILWTLWKNLVLIIFWQGNKMYFQLKDFFFFIKMNNLYLLHNLIIT